MAIKQSLPLICLKLAVNVAICFGLLMFLANKMKPAGFICLKNSCSLLVSEQEEKPKMNGEFPSKLYDDALCDDGLYDDALCDDRWGDGLAGLLEDLLVILTGCVEFLEGFCIFL